MLFERKLYGKLLQWKNEAAGEKALLIEGARRIGKSTLVAEFGRREYRSCLIIDFNDASDVVRDAFEHLLGDLDTFFLVLGTEYRVTLYRRDTLVVFDEVQAFPKARQAIKRLVADGRYDYIETGSLISVRENVRGITIPSEERRIQMHPMDFQEFCDALGESMLVDLIKDRFDQRKPLEDGLHRKAMLLFKQYMLVGGMPKPLSRYLENGRSFAAADEEKRDILSLYRADIAKVDSRYRSRVLSIFDQIPGFLSMHEKRVRLSNIEEGSTFPLYQDTFFWLGDSMIANECFACNDPNVGLSLNEDRTFVKCYMGDTGLLVSHAFSEEEVSDGELYRQIMRDNLSINEGMLFENAVAQCLVANGHELFFYTHYNAEMHRNDMEVDFVFSNGSKLKPKVFPVEVKSGKAYQTKSLDRFLERYGGRVGQAYIVHPKNLQHRGQILCIPSYMAMCL